MKHTWQVGTFTTVVCLMLITCCTTFAQEVLTREQARAMGDIFLEARNTPNMDLLDKIYAPDAVFHYSDMPEDIVGLEALKANYRQRQASFPDFNMSLDKMMIDGDHIIWMWSVSGTNTAPLGELPATGKSMSFSGTAIDRIEDGKIAEEWAYFNQLDLLKQLGFTIIPPASE